MGYYNEIDRARKWWDNKRTQALNSYGRGMVLFADIAMTVRQHTVNKTQFCLGQKVFGP